MTTTSARLSELLGAAAVETWTSPWTGGDVPLAAPGSVEQLVELVRLAASEGWRVLPLGASSKLGRTAAPPRVDLALTTRALAGVVAYEPGDGTLTALPGTRMDELARVAGGGGHHLTPDVPRPARATLGGVVSAGQSGADRLRYGPLRHHVLGTRVLLANGEVTRSGGRLVKNVTGFDLQRLYTGAHGTLGVLVEATLRLFPLPEAVACLGARYRGLAEALEAARTLRERATDPLDLVVEGDGDGARLTLVLAGRRRSVERAGEDLTGAVPGLERLADERVEAERARLRDLEPDDAVAPCLHVACRPSRMSAVSARARAVLDERGTAPAVVLRPGLATLDAGLAGLSVDGLAELVTALRAQLAPSRARVTLRCPAGALPPGLDPLDTPLPGADLQRRIVRALDPDGRFAARFSWQERGDAR